MTCPCDSTCRAASRSIGSERSMPTTRQSDAWRVAVSPVPMPTSRISLPGDRGRSRIAWTRPVRGEAEDAAFNYVLACAGRDRARSTVELSPALRFGTNRDRTPVLHRPGRWSRVRPSGVIVCRYRPRTQHRAELRSGRPFGEPRYDDHDSRPGSPAFERHDRGGAALNPEDVQAAFAPRGARISDPAGPPSTDRHTAGLVCPAPYQESISLDGVPDSIRRRISRGAFSAEPAPASDRAPRGVGRQGLYR